MISRNYDFQVHHQHLAEYVILSSQLETNSMCFQVSRLYFQLRSRVLPVLLYFNTFIATTIIYYWILLYLFNYPQELTIVEFWADNSNTLPEPPGDKNFLFWYYTL